MERQLGKSPLENDMRRATTWIRAATGEGGGLTHNAQFVTLAVDSGLTNERVLTLGTGLDGVDGGAGSTYTLSVDVTDIIDTDYGLTESGNKIRINPGVGLEFTGSPATLRLDEDVAPTWTAAHIFSDSITLEGDGPSTLLTFLASGGGGPDYVNFFIDVDAIAGDSDMIIQLCDAVGDSVLAIWDSGNAEVWHVDSDGGVLEKGPLTLDDGSGDSPALSFVGGTNDDTIAFYLLDNVATPGHSDLVLKLCDAGGNSGLIIRDNADVAAWWVNSDGDMRAEGEGYFGDDTAIDGVLTLIQQGEPSDPSDGSGVVWLSNGTGAGAPGDLMYKATEGAVTKTDTIVDFSEI